MLIHGKTAKATYDSMTGERQAYLDRARQVATLTLPHILPAEGYSGATLPTPYQSVGSMGISSRASKLMLVLFPPSQSFMRMDLRPGVQLDPKFQAEAQATLQTIEKAVTDRIEDMVLRPHIYECLLHLEVAGNVVLNLSGSKPRVHHLSNFVCKRDPAGELLLLITRECIAPELLPDSIREQIKAQEKLGNTGGDLASRQTVDIYTAIVRKDPNTYAVFQEACNVVIPKTEGTYKAEELPWIVLRSAPIAGESYAYGHAAALMGDLASLEGLMKSLVEAAAASSRLVFLVNPAAVARPAELNKAPNGSFVPGLPDDITPLKVDKAADMATAFQVIEKLSKSLGYAFLLNQSVQRSGERVTAEEIKFLAQELDDVQAGTYALLSQELQLRLVKVLMVGLRKEKTIPELDPKVATPMIVTGLEALGRGHDLLKLDTFIQGAVQTLGPDVIAQYLNVGDYLTRRSTALGINSAGLIRDEQEVQQMQAQAAQANLATQVAPEVVKQVGQAYQNRQQAQ